MFTFTVSGQFPVCCLFINDSSQLVFDTVEHITSHDPNMISLLIVYNSSTQALEVLDTHFKWYLVLSAQSTGVFEFVNNTAPGYSGNAPGVFQIDYSSDQLYITDYNMGVFAYLSSFVPGSAVNSLVFCESSSNCPQGSPVKVLNYANLYQLQQSNFTIQDPQTLCCKNDIPTIIEFFLNYAQPFSQASSNPNVFPSLESCQQVDSSCNCPTLNTCWMYNNLNVPCCIQGNPTNPVFAINKPVLVTKSQNDCVTAAVNCSQWRFNTEDVPCCVQRSMSEWSTLGFSTTGLQSFNDQASCNTAARQANCNFKALLTPPSNSSSTSPYYGLILESQYTANCDFLRHRAWGTSADCSTDPNPTACLTGNCTQNYCSTWLPSVSNSYLFTQDVRCLPSSQCCSEGKKQVITDPGQPDVKASCQ